MGSRTSEVLTQDWFQIGDEGSVIYALAMAGPVRFELMNGTVQALSIEDNDC